MLESGRFFRSITPCLLLTCFTLVLPSKTQKEESPYVKVSATGMDSVIVFISCGYSRRV